MITKQRDYHRVSLTISPPDTVLFLLPEFIIKVKKPLVGMIFMLLFAHYQSYYFGVAKHNLIKFILGFSTLIW